MRKAPATVLLGVVIVAGCGGTKSKQNAGEPAKSTPKTTSPSVVKTIAISEKEYSLSPATISVAKTGVYALKATNDGSVTHALEVEGEGVEQKTGNISPGQSATLKVALNKTGTYEIYCPIDGHRQMGMQAKLVLGTGGMGGGGGGTTTGQTSTGGGGRYGY